MGLNINFLNGQGLNTLLSLLYNRISGKADTPNANNMASASTAGYMSAVDFNKINAQAISANTDLDNITDDGWYCCTSDATASSLSHCPTTVAFYLEVHKHTSAGRYQYLVEYLPTGAKHYSRNFFGSWGSWAEWKLTDTTYSNATTSAAGLMSAADKTKLDACKKIVVCNSESAYNSLTKDSDTVYMILEETT